MGWEFALDRAECFVKVFEKCASMSASEFSCFFRNAKAYADEITSAKTTIEDYENLFTKVIE